jgi:hypothetical protein
VRVYPFSYFSGGYTNTETIAFKDYSSFRILDTKAAESAEDIEAAEAAKKESNFSKNMTIAYSSFLIACALAGGAYFIYDYYSKRD